MSEKEGKFWGVFIRILLYGFLLVAAFGVFYPVGGGKERSTKTACLSRLKMMSIATLLYAESNDERFPVKPWMEAIRRFGPKLNFNCAKLEEEDDLKWGYALERSVAGLQLTKIEDPTVRALFIETDALAPDMVVGLDFRSRSRHGMGSNIAFSDGTIKFRNRDWKPVAFNAP